MNRPNFRKLSVLGALASMFDGNRAGKSAAQANAIKELPQVPVDMSGYALGRHREKQRSHGYRAGCRATRKNAVSQAFNMPVEQAMKFQNWPHGWSARMQRAARDKGLLA